MSGYDWPRLHALLNDLPSALLVAALLFDLIGVLGRRPHMRQVGFWTLVLGAIGGVLAVLSGLQAEDSIAHGGAVHAVMEEHEQLGLITLGVFGVLAVWRIFRESRMGGGERALSLLATAVGIGLLVATGKHGGELVFDHAAGIPTRVLEAELRERSASHEHAGGETHEHAGGETHSHADAPVADSAAAHTDPPMADTASHTHAPGTPAHKH